MLNSLAQTLLKTTAPGVPDFYQGTELWSFTLVDPDNRRPVDYELRRALLASMRDAGDALELVNELLKRPEDGRVKLYVTSRALTFRRASRDLFARGSYMPLRAEGKRADNVIAFARASEDKTAVVVAGRFFTRLGIGDSGALRLNAEGWGDTRLQLGELQSGGRFRDVFTGREFDARDGTLALSEILSPLPVALLESIA
jgi:(1->4)-alpha-D-glucan 1-alpha-D-glucosylmutase